MKSIFSSKTFYVACAQAVIGVALTLDANVSPYLGLLLILKSLVDVVLRFVSTEEVTL